MHLYVLVAGPFVAELLGVGMHKNPEVGYYSSWIQAAFLFGWALGGGFFGMIADRIGRSRALMLTILTYAMFTGLSFFAQAWWHLLIFRFLAALGIGGEWAVGASLLSETWPRRWRPWMAAVLQTGVNLGVCWRAWRTSCWPAFRIAPYSSSAFCRRCWCCGFAAACPSLKSGSRLKASHGQCASPSFSRPVSRLGTSHDDSDALVCGLSLSAHWAFLFWYLQHLGTCRGQRLDRCRSRPAG